MQISKSFLAVCVATLGLVAPGAHARDGQDTEVQAKAREALRQKMKDLQTQPPAVSTDLAAKPGALSAPNATDAETKKQVAARIKARQDAERAAKAEAEASRKAAAKRQAETEAQAKAEARLKAEAQAKPKAESKPQPSAIPQKAAEAKPQPPTKAPAQAKAADQKPAAAPGPGQPAAAKPAPTAKNAPAFQPLPVPVLPLSGDKQQKLAELLRKYRADEITPEQYHTERAKILAEP